MKMNNKLNNKIKIIKTHKKYKVKNKMILVFKKVINMDLSVNNQIRLINNKKLYHKSKIN